MAEHQKFFLMLCLLIPSKQSVTSEHFDVYLAPLIEELLQLWYGIPAFDITQEEGSCNFTLRAILIWTIHDFPGYGTVGGFAHQGFTACPWCGEELGVEYSTELGKQTYGGCRRWLSLNHIFRSEELKDHFNGWIETRGLPARVSVEEQLRYGEKYAAWKATGNRDGAVGDPSKKHGVKRISILYTLPYWKVFFFRSSIRNVCNGTSKYKSSFICFCVNF
jgi:hypothetical protein